MDHERQPRMRIACHEGEPTMADHDCPWDDANGTLWLARSRTTPTADLRQHNHGQCQQQTHAGESPSPQRAFLCTTARRGCATDHVEAKWQGVVAKDNDEAEA